MFGIGSTELIVILVVALIIIGPQKLPDLMRTLGKGLSEFRNMSNDVKRTLDQEVAAADDERRKQEVAAMEAKRRKEEQEAMEKAHAEKTESVDEESTDSEPTEVEDNTAEADVVTGVRAETETAYAGENKDQPEVEKVSTSLDEELEKSTGEKA